MLSLKFQKQNTYLLLLIELIGHASHDRSMLGPLHSIHRVHVHLLTQAHRHSGWRTMLHLWRKSRS